MIDLVDLYLPIRYYPMILRLVEVEFTWTESSLASILHSVRC